MVTRGHRDRSGGVLRRDTMKYKLQVSTNAGISYHTSAESDDYMDFAEKCRRLDEDGLRWHIQDDGEDLLSDEKFLCLIHKAIFRDIAVMSGQKVGPYVPAFYEEDLGKPVIRW